MNKVILLGRLTRDAEVRYSQGENATAIAKFGFAVPRRYKNDGQDCDFINCVAFGKQAEFIEKHTQKGIKLLIEGRWQSGSYTNRDGQKVYTNDCVVESCNFVESKNAGQNDTPKPIPQTGSDGWMNIPNGIDEESPFS